MSTLVLDKSTAKLGVRIQNLWGDVGVIRWVGELKKPSGFFCGVEYDEPRVVASRTDGIAESGQQYYIVKIPHTGEFVKVKYLMKESWPQLADKLAPLFPQFSREKLMKFLLARKCNEKLAVEMMTKHVLWMRDVKPDCNEGIPRSIAKVYPVGWYGEDLEGNLLYIERPGNGGVASPKEIINTYGIELFTRWHITLMECLQKKMQEVGSVRCTLLIDLSNLGMVNSKVTAWAKAIAAIDQDNYPETVARIIIVNAPSIFKTVWAVVKSFIDERTRDKIIIFDTDKYKEELLKYIPEAYIPSFAGGKCDNYLANGGYVGTPIDFDAPPPPAGGGKDDEDEDISIPAEKPSA